LIAECVGAVWSNIATVAIIVGSREAGIGIVGCTKDLKSFEECGEEDLEVRQVMRRQLLVFAVFFVWFGGWERTIEGCEQSFVEKNDT
jgi:hypothetical protein